MQHEQAMQSNTDIKTKRRTQNSKKQHIQKMTKKDSEKTITRVETERNDGEEGGGTHEKTQKITKRTYMVAKEVEKKQTNKRKHTVVFRKKKRKKSYIIV